MRGGYSTTSTVSTSVLDLLAPPIFHSVEARGAAAAADPEAAAKEEIADKVFQQVYIPNKLDDVLSLERDLKLAASGNTEEVRQGVGPGATEPLFPVLICRRRRRLTSRFTITH